MLQKYNDLYPNLQREFGSYEKIKSSVLAVNVFYDDLSYTIIEEQPLTTAYQLFSNLGGLLGVTIGTSLMMFVELAELTYMMVYSFLNAKSKS